MTKIPEANNLREDRCILAHGFGPLSLDSYVSGLWWKGMVEENYSPLAAKKQRETGGGQGQDVSFRGSTSSNHAPFSNSPFDYEFIDEFG